MCGIVGYSGTSPVPQYKLKILMLYARNRGTDASGYGYTKETNEGGITYAYYKGTTDSKDLVTFKGKIPPVDVIIGHTRSGSYTTKKNKECAHPFIFGNLVGAHNGYITNYEAINSLYNLDYEVDSHSLYHLISDKGLEPTLKEVYGNMALCWITGKKTLNLYRHNNPTFIGYDKNANLWFASQEEYLKAIGCKDIKSTKEHTHYVIEDGVILERKKIKTKPLYSQDKPRQKYYPQNKIGFNDSASCAISKPIKIRSIHAPEHAPDDCLIYFDEGKMMYYWFPEENTISIETIESFAHSKLDTFNLNVEKEKNRFAKEYPKLQKDLIA